MKGVIWIFILVLLIGVVIFFISSFINDIDTTISNIAEKKNENKSKEIENLALSSKAQSTEREIYNKHISQKNWLLHLYMRAKDLKDVSLDIPSVFTEYRLRKKFLDVSDSKQKIKDLKRSNKVLSNQIENLKDKFPILEDLEYEILNDLIDFKRIRITENYALDPVRNYIRGEEYHSLPEKIRNQKALENYLSNLSKLEVGKMYERQVGWIFEKAGGKVQYEGLLKGFEDHGRDFIVGFSDSGAKLVIQAKCWSAQKTIYEKHIFQLFGTTYELSLADPNTIWLPVFVTTTKLSDYALEVAHTLKIEIMYIPLSKNWPMIKCVESRNHQLSYLLPFDPDYDKVVDLGPKGFRTNSAIEAEERGVKRYFHESLSTQPSVMS